MTHLWMFVKYMYVCVCVCIFCKNMLKPKPTSKAHFPNCRNWIYCKVFSKVTKFWGLLNICHCFEKWSLYKGFLGQYHVFWKIIVLLKINEKYLFWKYLVYISSQNLHISLYFKHKKLKCILWYTFKLIRLKCTPSLFKCTLNHWSTF